MENVYEFKFNDYKTVVFKNYNTLKKDSNLFGEQLEFRPIRQMFEPDGPTKFDEESFLKNIKNIFSNIIHFRIHVIICQDENKVSLKFFTYHREKKVGKPYFEKSTRLRYLTYNKKTNSLYDGSVMNYHKKRKYSKTVRKNNFFNFPFEKIIGDISSVMNSIQTSLFDKNIKKELILSEIEKHFMSLLPQNEDHLKINKTKKLYKIFADKYNIKLPNNWEVFYYAYPSVKIKLLRKNKMKFIDSFMITQNLKGDKIKKVLHKIKSFTSTSQLNWAYNFFGEDYILSQNESFLVKLLETDTYAHEYTNYSLTKEEKNKIFKIYELCLEGKIDFYTLTDHLGMLEFIKKYEKIKWKSETIDHFQDEHLLLSNKMSFYKVGNYFRLYDQKFIDEINKEIDGYYPVILTTTEEYNQESFIQSNCVKTYIDRPSSIIISLRKDNPKSTNRATIEFQLSKINDNLNSKVVQKLGKYNSPLTEEWKEIIEKLEIKFQNLLNEINFNGFDVIYNRGNIEKNLQVKFLESFEQNKETLQFVNN